MAQVDGEEREGLPRTPAPDNSTSELIQGRELPSAPAGPANSTGELIRGRGEKRSAQAMGASLVKNCRSLTA